MKILSYITAICFIILVFSACNKPMPPPSVSEQPNTSSSESAIEESTPEIVTTNPTDKVDEMEIPAMHSTNQEYYDKYLISLNAIPFLIDFSKDDYSIFFTANVYSCLTGATTVEEVAQDDVENLIKVYFPITSERMRLLSGEQDYSAQKGTYKIPIYTPMIEWRGVVTNSILKDDILTLSCDWYASDLAEPEAGTYILRGTSETIIQLNPDNTWTYISNKSNVQR